MPVLLALNAGIIGMTFTSTKSLLAMIKLVFAQSFLLFALIPALLSMRAPILEMTRAIIAVMEGVYMDGWWSSR